MREVLLKEEDVQVGSFVQMNEEVASPWSSWGSQLPPASPPVSVPLPTWRPWEQKPNKLRKRSPASEARSLHRLHEWQQRMDLRRASEQPTRECSRTPLPPGKELKNIRLLKMLEDVQRGKFGSQAFSSCQWSGSQTSPASPSWFVSQTPAASSPWSSTQITPATPSWSGSQTAPATPSWSGSQTNSTRVIGSLLALLKPKPCCSYHYNPWCGSPHLVLDIYPLTPLDGQDQLAGVPGARSLPWSPLVPPALPGDLWPLISCWR